MFQPFFPFTISSLSRCAAIHFYALFANRLLFSTFLCVCTLTKPHFHSVHLFIKYFVCNLMVFIAHGEEKERMKSEIGCVELAVSFVASGSSFSFSWFHCWWFDLSLFLCHPALVYLCMLICLHIFYSFLFNYLHWSSWKRRGKWWQKLRCRSF